MKTPDIDKTLTFSGVLGVIITLIGAITSLADNKSYGITAIFSGIIILVIVAIAQYLSWKIDSAKKEILEKLQPKP